jgi:magnesium chelatase accessory protein
VRWHVEVTGSGPALVLVHGTGSSGHSFRDIVPILAERFTVVVPDLPGHGRSTMSARFAPSLPRMAASLARLLRSLELTPSVAVGHSAGAAVVARMTIDGLIAPRLIVGLAAALVPLRGLERKVFPEAARILSAAADVFSFRIKERNLVRLLLASTGSYLEDAGVEHYAKLFASPEHVSAVLSMMAEWDLTPLFRDLAALETPLLLLAGEDDRAIPLAQQQMVVSRVSSARLEVLRGVGHLLHEEHPATVASSILREADRLADPPRPQR